MLKNFLVATFIFTSFTFGYSQYKSTWKIFENATFHDELIEAYGAYAALLTRTAEMEALDGREITITGYYIPVEEDVFIISKFPNANCFFCGNAGMESVMEVRARSPLKRRFATDDLLTFSGSVKVNFDDWQYVSFILEDARLIEK